MKVAIYSESRADQAALAVLVEGLMESPLEPASQNLEGRGVSNVLAALRGVYLGTHYHSDAEALVVVVDSDRTTLHELDHNPMSAATPDCRLCEMKRTIEWANRNISPRSHLPPLRIALGLTVPAIEGWYLIGKEHQIGEAAWRTSVTERSASLTARQLKLDVYGKEHLSIETVTAMAVTEAQRIVSDGLLARLETIFPAGFGTMAETIRGWR